MTVMPGSSLKAAPSSTLSPFSLSFSLSLSLSLSLSAPPSLSLSRSLYLYVSISRETALLLMTLLLVCNQQHPEAYATSLIGKVGQTCRVAFPCDNSWLTVRTGSISKNELFSRILHLSPSGKAKSGLHLPPTSGSSLISTGK